MFLLIRRRIMANNSCDGITLSLLIKIVFKSLIQKSWSWRQQNIVNNILCWLMMMINLNTSYVIYYLYIFVNYYIFGVYQFYDGSCIYRLTNYAYLLPINIIIIHRKYRLNYTKLIKTILFLFYKTFDLMAVFSWW